jgi:hypothetical protein
MKRWLPIFVFITLACVLPSIATNETHTPTNTPENTQVLTVIPSLTAQPTFTPTPALEVTPTLVPHLLLETGSIHIYPTDLYSNDYFSIDVAPQIDPGLTDNMTLTVNLPDGNSLSQSLEPWGLDEEYRARFIWVSQVPDDAAELTLTFSLEYLTHLNPLEAQIASLTTSTRILPSDLITPPEPLAQWASTETEGFRIHYITGSKAERDLDFIVSEANLAYIDVTKYLTASREAIDIYILDKVIGQGGYASTDWVAISYPDRAYSPTDLGSLLRHELTHRLDSSIGCSEAPSFLREGLAVFLANGHYRKEPVVIKASTAMANGYITPMTLLINDFYLQQHEISYLEAAAFVSYIESQYGWEGIRLMCRTSVDTEGTDLDKIDAASQELANIDAANLMAQHRSWLMNQPVTQIDRELFEYELQLMDLMRQYQKIYDPAAHFLKGILFSPEQGLREGIVADFVRKPISDEAIAIELILTAGQDAVTRQDVQFLKTVLRLLDAVLDKGQTDIEVFSEVKEIVEYTKKLGFLPYNLEFLGRKQYELAVLNLTKWPQKLVVQIGWHNDRWMIVGGR